MPLVRLADTRLLTPEDARATLEALAHAECRIASAAARTERRIATLKSQFETDTTADRELKGRLEANLTAYILAHRDQFEDPRSMKTQFGEFGLRALANKLTVADSEAVIQWALDNGYDDLVETTRTLVKDAVKERIKAGQDVPGCAIPAGEAPYYKVAKSLLAAASTLADEPAGAAVA